MSRATEPLRGAGSNDTAARAREEITRAPAVVIDERVRADYRRLLTETPDALYRDGPARSPEGAPLHLTASAFVLDASGEHLALVWHPRGRCWVQPGGHVDRDDDSLESAARREVAEETSLRDLERVGEGPAMLQPHDLAGTFGACGGHWDVPFVLRAHRSAADAPVHAEGPEGGAIWVPWPRASDGSWPPPTDLPEDVAADIPSLLERLTGFLDAYRGVFAAPTHH